MSEALVSGVRRPEKLTRRPAGYHSNAAYLADEGKYRHPEDGESDEFACAVADVMRQQHRVLIVGSAPGTFDDKLRRHPLLLFWPSTERAVSDQSRVVPAEVGAILLTNQLSHALSHNVREQAKHRHLLCTFSPLSPGAVRRTLTKALDIERGDAQETTDMPAKATPILRSVEPTTELPEPDPDIIRLIDDTVAGLQLIREAAVKMVDESQHVRKQVAALDALLGLLK
jgi:hypothetical protein